MNLKGRASGPSCSLGGSPKGKSGADSTAACFVQKGQHKLLLRHLAPLPLPFDPLPDLVWNVPNQQLVAHDPARLWEVLIAALISTFPATQGFIFRKSCEGIRPS